MTDEEKTKELRRFRLRDIQSITFTIILDTNTIIGLLDRMAETHKEYKQAIIRASLVNKYAQLLKIHLAAYSVD